MMLRSGFTSVMLPIHGTVDEVHRFGESGRRCHREAVRASVDQITEPVPVAGVEDFQCVLVEAVGVFRESGRGDPRLGRLVLNK